MPALLPPDPPISPTNRVMADAPNASWGAALSALRARMDLPTGPWRRLPTGKNVVIELGEEAILKLIPPYWSEDAQREAEALRLVPLDGPVAIPTLLALDMLDGWTVLLLRRLPGTILSEQWPSLSGSQRAELAAQLGAVAAWLHRVEVPPGSPLAYDWAAHIESEAEAAPQQLAQDGAPAELQDSWPTFLRSVGPLPSPGSAPVLLHGDLSVANVLVREDTAGRWRVTGLLDFGDASLGEFTHDWLSPGVHNFGGDPAVVGAFCDGYGLPTSQRTSALQAHLLARSLLYYGWRYLRHKSPLQGATTWQEVASIVWPIMVGA
ncbi:MAG: aminoglycoside phosphotransferase family protein [Chloroflexota bacterium]|nr:aminoglycoside phosphotransferase family protein [Chloroflexota bacterium]MDQ5864900.1 aminoglycoside phosphotransferase family protein [Chloroflexota bacterium]